MATHSSVLAWRIPGTGEPGGLPSLGSQSRTRLKWLSSSSSSTSSSSSSSHLQIKIQNIFCSSGLPPASSQTPPSPNTTMFWFPAPCTWLVLPVFEPHINWIMVYTSLDLTSFVQHHVCEIQTCWCVSIAWCFSGVAYYGMNSNYVFNNKSSLIL